MGGSGPSTPPTPEEQRKHHRRTGECPHPCPWGMGGFRGGLSILKAPAGANSRRSICKKHVIKGNVAQIQTAAPGGGASPSPSPSEIFLFHPRRARGGKRFRIPVKKNPLPTAAQTQFQFWEVLGILLAREKAAGIGGGWGFFGLFVPGKLRSAAGRGLKEDFKLPTLQCPPLKGEIKGKGSFSSAKSCPRVGIFSNSWPRCPPPAGAKPRGGLCVPPRVV